MCIFKGRAENLHGPVNGERAEPAALENVTSASKRLFRFVNVVCYFTAVQMSGTSLHDSLGLLLREVIDGLDVLVVQLLDLCGVHCGCACVYACVYCAVRRMKSRSLPSRPAERCPFAFQCTARPDGKRATASPPPYLFLQLLRLVRRHPLLGRLHRVHPCRASRWGLRAKCFCGATPKDRARPHCCLLYTSDAADEL